MEKKPRKPRKDGAMCKLAAIGFISKVERLSVPMIEEEDLNRMRNYQCALINELLYFNPANGNDSTRTSRLITEIRAVEAWFKIEFPSFVNNNNRKFAQ